MENNQYLPQVTLEVLKDNFAAILTVVIDEHITKFLAIQQFPRNIIILN